jgi:hypothetical protein
MAISFDTLSQILPVVSGAGFPVLIRGRHGIGKSEGVYQFAKAVGMPVIERRASQMTEGDLLGLPDQNGVDVAGRKATSYNPPAWLLEACTRPVILFIDEIDRATTEVRQGFFELTDSRKIAGFTLHPDTVIIAAVNGGENASEYSVADMDPAEQDRYTTFDVAPTVEDWLGWATGADPAERVCAAFTDVRDVARANRVLKASGELRPVDEMIVDFIRQNPEHIEHTDTFEPGKVYPSRRSWVRFSDAGRSACLFDDCKANRALIAHLSAGFVGLEASIAFTDFSANYERQVSVEDIMVHGRIDRVEDFGVIEHTAMVSKITGSDFLAREMTPAELQNLANYFVRVPSEVGMTLFSAIAQGDLGPTNISEFYAITADNGVSVQEHVSEVL